MNDTSAHLNNIINVSGTCSLSYTYASGEQSLSILHDTFQNIPLLASLLVRRIRRENENFAQKITAERDRKVAREWKQDSFQRGGGIKRFKLKQMSKQNLVTSLRIKSQRKFSKYLKVNIGT